MRQRSKQTPPTTRRGGPLTFRGQVFETEAELERALVGALVDAGWRVTPKGAAYLARVEADEARGEQQWDAEVNR